MEQRPNQRVDPNYPRRFSSYFNQFISNNRSILRNVAIVFLRLPSVLLADLVLINSNQIVEYFESSLNQSLSSLMVYFVSKFVLLIILFFCLLLFVLTPHNVIRMYNIFGLVSQPFLFTYLIESTPRDQSIFFHSLKVPRLFLIFLIYTLTITLTIIFYYQTYYKFILDKYEIYRYYQLYNNNGEESHFLELLTNDGYKSIKNLVLQDHEIKGKVQELNNFLAETRLFFDAEQNKPNSLRLWIIVSYSLFGFIINEWMDREERINAISLGYLCLLGYDLMSNLDQMLLRLLLRIKIFARKFSNNSASQLPIGLSSEHINAKMVLKSYFLFKIIIFILNFLKHKNYYISLDQQLPSINQPNSLFLQLKSYFFKDIEKSHQENSPSYENFLYSSTWSQLVSLFDQPLDYNTQVEIKFWTKILLFIKFLIFNQTCSVISLLSTTIIISYKFRLIGLYLRRQIYSEESLSSGQNSEDLSNVGEVTGILFFLLSLQSSITSLSGYERIEKFYKNYSLLFIAVLHYFHTSLDIKLRRLSNVAWNEQHKRLIKISFLMILTPSILIILSLKYFEFSTWLLSISAFNAELIVKMAVSVLLYSLYMLDRKRALEDEDIKSDHGAKDGISSSMDKFDDYIYYIKVFGHVFEFLVAILLFLNSGYILLFESYGAIRALMILLHAYFHIWCQAYYGWLAFKNRRKLVEMFDKLPQFDQENFVKIMKKKHPEKDDEALASIYDEKLTDSCSICFDRLSRGRALMTRCDHVFHYRCIRRWLNQNQNCPMCKRDVF
ncbi:TRC8 -like protein [Brachionus plicatilis]|uniref:TRC8-like protein n=1 Tax=Brachionus plicatilis TaxID=10195 RepID=A0A3M7PGV7_BRAPC|nr:TRC8 -like protein [Brachionus plicatilis]